MSATMSSMRGRTGRDLQNIPVEEVNRMVRRMAYPGSLDFAEKKKLVTLYLNPSTIRFFKKQAEKNHTKYQRLMRAVLGQYSILKNS